MMSGRNGVCVMEKNVVISESLCNNFLNLKLLHRIYFTEREYQITEKYISASHREICLNILGRLIILLSDRK